ncbi:MAG: glycerophosphodiester phosphodiesterase [Pseudonocardiales bacterium]|nr:MAG: glycerophosphodiester phosphodiesterase [Pseudonocardiales bacterium]
MRPRSDRVGVDALARPNVVAHRGASSLTAEHTLDAYVSAIESGADALECDVRMTRDGHLVCVHDRTVNRTSDGRGVVSDLDLDGLNSLNFSSWHSDLPTSADQLLTDSPYLDGVAPDRAGPDGGVLTLERLLELVHDAPRPVRVLIETKHPTRYQGLVEKELVHLLARFGWAGDPGPEPSLRHLPNMANRATVMSFAPTALRRVKLMAPDVPTVLLMDRLLPLRRDGVLPAGVPVAGPSLRMLRALPEYVGRAHARGHRVYVWTVDEPDDVQFVLELGVDTIITNRPVDVIRHLDSAQ